MISYSEYSSSSTYNNIWNSWNMRDWFDNMIKKGGDRYHYAFWIERVVKSPVVISYLSNHKLGIQLHNFHCSYPLQWHHNDRDGVSNHQPHNCLLNLFSMCRSKKTSKLCVTALCAENSQHTGQVTRKMFPFDDVIMIILIIETAHTPIN